MTGCGVFLEAEPGRRTTLPGPSTLKLLLAVAGRLGVDLGISPRRDLERNMPVREKDLRMPAKVVDEEEEEEEVMAEEAEEAGRLAGGADSWTLRSDAKAGLGIDWNSKTSPGSSSISGRRGKMSRPVAGSRDGWTRSPGTMDASLGGAARFLVLGLGSAGLSSSLGVFLEGIIARFRRFKREMSCIGSNNQLGEILEADGSQTQVVTEARRGFSL
jgi:hypothetical protein